MAVLLFLLAVAGGRTTERQAGPVEDQRLASAKLGLGPAADPHDRRVGGMGTAHVAHLLCEVFCVVAQDTDLPIVPVQSGGHDAQVVDLGRIQPRLLPYAGLW